MSSRAQGIVVCVPSPQGAGGSGNKGLTCKGPTLARGPGIVCKSTPQAGELGVLAYLDTEG